MSLFRTPLLFEDDTSHDWTSFISVVVGGSKPEVPSQTATYGATKTFLVHETTIRASSPFFEAALSNPQWKEARNRTVPLEQHTPEVFEVYLRWVYSRRGITLKKTDDKEIAKNAYTSLLCRAYVLGDVLLDFDFKDAVIDALTIYTLSNCYCWIEVKYIYGNTSKESKLRYWLVAVAVGGCGPKHLALEELSDFLPPEFLRDALVRTDRVAFPGHARNQDEEKYGLHRLGGFRASYSDLLKDPCLLHEHGVEKMMCYRFKDALDKGVHRSPWPN